MPNHSRLLGGRVAAVLLALGAGACEKQVREARTPPTATPQSLPADASVTTPDTLDPAPAAAVIAPPPTRPADSKPAPAALSIDGIDVLFPPTRLLLHERDGEMTAELFSDLPKSALRNYEGNELYLKMKLEGADGALATSDAKKIEGASWRFKSNSSEKADSPNGLFLKGQATHLQPVDVLVTFERRGADGGKPGQIVAHLAGQFRSYEPGTPEGLAPFAAVNGDLPVEIVQIR